MSRITNLNVPAILLKDPLERRINLSNRPLPESAPSTDSGRLMSPGAAEEMHMVRHHHVSANQPVGGPLPCLIHRKMGDFVRENPASRANADCNKENRWIVRADDRWRMSRMAVKLIRCSGHECCYA